ncbi:MAG: sensor histidine kinase [Gammaproteobacteria bacterium]
MFDRLMAGHRVVQALVLALLLLVMVDLVVRHLLLHGDVLAQHWLAVAPGLLVAVLLVGVALVATFLLPGTQDPKADGLGTADGIFVAVVLLGFVWVLLETWMELGHSSRAVRHVAYQAYQAVLAGVTCLLLLSSRRQSWLDWLLCLWQWCAGAALLAAHFLQETPPRWIWTLWQTGNVLLSTALFLLVAFSLVMVSSARAWLPLLAGLMGLGIVMEDLVAKPPEGLTLTLVHQIYAGLLMLVWMIASGRMELDGHLARQRRPPSDASLLVRQFAHSGLYGNRAGGNDLMAGQVIHVERQRIAQELHDGVGSQMVAILASLDREDPRMAAVASSLEQCLLEVKILVDAVDDTDEHVIDSLGRLRYRLQPSLDRLGIALHWDVPLDGPLTRVRRERSRQILRVAQEALANAMRYAGASAIALRCGLDISGRALELEIRDNGLGMHPDRLRASTGKGITGMRRRAAAIGGMLEIDTVQARGTRVRLTVPLGPPVGA